MSTFPISGPFAPWTVPFFLEIRQDSREKMVWQRPKFLATGHIANFQTSARLRAVPAFLIH